MAQQAWNMGIQRIAISHASDAYNISVSQVFAEHFKALGGRVVINQVHQPKQASYLAEARAVAAGAPDVAVFSYSSAGGVQFLKDLLSLEGVRHALGTDGLMANELATTLSVAELQRVTFVLAAADTEREGYKRWMAMARAAGLKPDGSYVAHAYDAAFLMALAIEASGGADKTKVSAGLRAISGPGGTFIYPGEFAKAKALIKKGLRINYDGASGPVDFDAAGDITGRASINWFSNGAWHAVLLK
jgi:branched-chain amino acid transport system substrate-binding protein